MPKGRQPGITNTLTGKFFLINPFLGQHCFGGFQVFGLYKGVNDMATRGDSFYARNPFFHILFDGGARQTELDAPLIQLFLPLIL
jgi:hypothetical protein